MYPQREVIRAAKSMDLNATFTLDLPEHGYMSSLMLELYGDEATGYGQAGGDWTLLDKISKIEVIGNGSTVIKSLTGKELQALAVWDQGVMPPSVRRNYATNTQFDYLLINFGRWLWDTELFLDLERFDNVELKITNTATAASFSAVYARITAYWLRELSLASRIGYLRTEEWQQWDTVSDEWKYLNLPTEHLIRRIMLVAEPDVDANYVCEARPQDLMYDIKLALDTGNLIVFDARMADLMRENFLDFGKELISAGYNYNNADKGWDISLGYVLGGAASVASHSGAASTSAACIGAVETTPTQHTENYQADMSTAFIFRGIAPFDSALFRFDHLGDPAGWLDPDRRKTVKLDIHTRSGAAYADGKNRVVLDRLVR